MWRGVAWGVRAGAVIGAAVLGGMYAGCGDLVVPNAGGGDGGGDGSGDGDTLDDGFGVDAGLDGRAARLDCTGQDAAFGPPSDLGCTGLYSDWARRTLNPDAKEFDPGLHLWSDGAQKTRWILVPPGQKIDTADMNEWRFPVGTKLWKEF